MDRIKRKVILMFGLGIVFLTLGVVQVQAAIDGITGTNFTLTAKEDFISTQDGGSLLLWGYANGTGRAQYPGSTLIVNQNATVTVELTNQLSVPVSIVFPGHQVSAETVSGSTADGLLTLEANTGGTVRYTFTASKPGTYMYHSGTRPELQVEMGLVGTIIVRPSGFNPAAPTAYGHPGSAYDREYLFFLTEMDPRIHDVVEFMGIDALAWFDYLSNYFPNYWFINGRTAVDTMDVSNSPGMGLFPTQPYNILPLMHPGDRVLLRVVGAGRQTHPFHHHGNHARVIARDGRLLDTGTSAGLPDLSTAVFTIQSVPGQTVDAIFDWTGKGMNWDIYGTGPGYEHNCIDLVDNRTGALVPDGYADATSDHPWEWCADHGKPIPVTLPAFTDLTMGPFFTGSPYLGKVELLPPGQGGFNPWGAYVFMWHSHNEKELLNYGVFPGGLMTMGIILPPGVPIE
jgi:hypothetical protein